MGDTESHDDERDDETTSADHADNDDADNDGADGGDDADQGADDDVPDASDDDGADDDAPDESDESNADDGDNVQEKKKSSMGSLIGVVGFLLALGGGFLVGQYINKPNPYDAVANDPRLNVNLRGDEPQVGPDDALVTIIEFADYQCPYCQQGSPPLMKAIAGYEGKVRVIYKHLPLPFHKAALPAAKAAWAAMQQGAFWPFHEALFVSKSDLGVVDGLIAEHKLDADKFKADMGSPAAAKSIDDDMKAASMLGITGTPAFVVNGHHYRGKRDYSQWKQIIDAELDAAEDVVSGGVAPGAVYAHLMSDALTKRSPPPAAGGGGGAGGGPDPAKRYQVKPEGRASLGPDDALVTIVEFSDFQCPYCSKMAPVAHEVVERHSDVRFVFRNLPLSMHPQARPAALAAVAAGRQGKFWEMHDKLFAEQKSIPDAVSDGFADWAEALSLDVDQFKADYASDAVAKEVDHDVAVARRFGVRGTPGSFVNGRFISGAVGTDGFDALITSERAAAQKLIDEGTAPDRVLDTLLADALQRVMPPKKGDKKKAQGT